MPIDMHAHWIPKGLAEVFRTRSKPPRIVRGEDGREYMDSGFTKSALPEAFDELETRLAEMDKNGITRGVLSLTPFYGIECMPLAEAGPLCRTFNDEVSSMCVARPDRFSGLAALPVADLGAMLAEFERAMSLPGMVGAVLPGDAFLSAKRGEKMRPLLDSADRRRAILLVHYGKLVDDAEAPRIDASDNPHSRYGTLDMQARLSQNMVTFCMTDFLKPYPNLTMMSHNLGGNIPFEISRLDHRSLIDRPQDELPSKRIRAGRVLVDCNSLDARAIELAVEAYGADKIVLGSDGTAFGMQWTMNALREARLSVADKRRIADENAEAALARVKTGYAQAAE
jgi:predicted TIM-barrel fold metal-dependent hydrolase